ncbi:hypothetical protein ECC02_003124 [Trypanosoma cruzi]|uniref:Uncharacterized protein n=1 Tax=Trypanosoma cruzi TaxID=5693 RepID=A0A7J6YBK9_TRYCR|nr:hypothetical protein ECC02_003124 [Trypanosoma cruzi]
MHRLRGRLPDPDALHMRGTHGRVAAQELERHRNYGKRCHQQYRYDRDRQVARAGSIHVRRGDRLCGGKYQRNNDNCKTDPQTPRGGMLAHVQVKRFFPLRGLLTAQTLFSPRARKVHRQPREARADERAQQNLSPNKVRVAGVVVLLRLFRVRRLKPAVEIRHQHCGSKSTERLHDQYNIAALQGNLQHQRHDRRNIHHRKAKGGNSLVKSKERHARVANCTVKCHPKQNKAQTSKETPNRKQDCGTHVVKQHSGMETEVAHAISDCADCRDVALRIPVLIPQMIRKDAETVIGRSAEREIDASHQHPHAEQIIYQLYHCFLPWCHTKSKEGIQSEEPKKKPHTPLKTEIVCRHAVRANHDRFSCNGAHTFVTEC